MLVHITITFNYCLNYFVHAVLKGFNDIIDDLGDLLLHFLRSIRECVRDIGCKEQREIIVFVTVGLSDPDKTEADAGLPKNAVLGRTYTDGTRKEPGDRTNAVEGIQSLDLRDLEDRASETKRE